MAEKSLDQFDKFREKFNEKFRKITSAEVKKLTDGQKKIYDEIVKNENIAAVPIEGKRFSNLGSDVRLREFDSETYKQVKITGPNFVRSGSEKRQKRRDKASRDDTRMTGELSLGGSGYTKGYDTGLNMPVPTRRPRAAPKETLQQRNMGGKIHRGRKAASSADKND